MSLSCDNYIISTTNETKDSTTHFIMGVQLQLLYIIIMSYHFLGTPAKAFIFIRYAASNEKGNL